MCGESVVLSRSIAISFGTAGSKSSAYRADSALLELDDCIDQKDLTVREFAMAAVSPGNGIDQYWERFERIRGSLSQATMMGWAALSPDFCLLIIRPRRKTVAAWQSS